MSENEAAIQAYLDAHSKSRGAGFLLALFFGPLGLFYSNWLAALIMCVIAIAGWATIIVPVICWILSMLLCFVFVGSANTKIEAQARLIAQGRT